VTAGAPAVSVLVTTYRHARFVEEALESLRAQTCSNFETIITDDASNDGTGDIIERWLGRTGFPARFIRNPTNRGICANRNAALDVAQGRFVASLSGDDAYTPDRIERQLACFLEQPSEVAAVYSDAVLMDADSRDLGVSYIADKLGGAPQPDDAGLFRKLLLDDCFLPAPAVMVRRRALDAVGRYDESFYFEDLYMWLELSHRFRFHFLPGMAMIARRAG
jgi:glycosyltransferase involved in cell wall biosynthesis